MTGPHASAWVDSGRIFVEARPEVPGMNAAATRVLIGTLVTLLGAVPYDDCDGTRPPCICMIADNTARQKLNP